MKSHQLLIVLLVLNLGATLFACWSPAAAQDVPPVLRARSMGGATDPTFALLSADDVSPMLKLHSHDGIERVITP